MLWAVSLCKESWSKFDNTSQFFNRLHLPCHIFSLGESALTQTQAKTSAPRQTQANSQDLPVKE
jgi:hypothetical protein